MNIKDKLFPWEYRTFDVTEYTVSVFFEDFHLYTKVFDNGPFISNYDGTKLYEDDCNPRREATNYIDRVIKAVPFSFLDRYAINDVNIVDDYKKLRFSVKERKYSQTFRKRKIFGIFDSSFFFWEQWD
jgi:hypothetical protein